MALAVALTILAAAAAQAQTGGGYAGIDGSARPVPTPTDGMFSPRPSASAIVAPPATVYTPGTSYNRYRGLRGYPHGSMRHPRR